MPNAEQKANDLIELLEASTSMGYIGEAITQKEHALQAAHFASQSGYSEEVILACLLHDIGHFIDPAKMNEMDGLGCLQHDTMGQNHLLSLGINPMIAELVGFHVEAKRYLVSSKPQYFENLSQASRQTLAFQGGKMSAQEIIEFKQRADFKAILQLRVCDEKAKVPNLNVAPLSAYRDRLAKQFTAV